MRDYALASWIDADTLVLCASYSGETEETLACFDAAGAAGAPRVVMTTGGTLAELARDDGVPVIGVPAGMQPRAAVVYMTVGALECAALAARHRPLRAEIEAASALLRTTGRGVGPGRRADDSLAKALARGARRDHPRRLRRRSTAAPARRWRTQINENAELARVLDASCPRRTTTRSAAGSAARGSRRCRACSSATRTSTRA